MPRFSPLFLSRVFMLGSLFYADVAAEGPSEPTPPPVADLKALTEYFFRNPYYDTFDLTPDCETLAYRYYINDNPGLRLLHYPSKKHYDLTPTTNNDIYEYGWADNKLLLYKIYGPRLGDRLCYLSIERFTPTEIDLKSSSIGYGDLGESSDVGSELGLQLEDTLPNAEGIALISTIYDGSRIVDYPDLKSLVIKGDYAKTVGKNDGSIEYWWTDDQGTPWAVTKLNPETKLRNLYARYDPKTEKTSEITALTGSSTRFLNLSRDGTVGLICSDFDNGDTKGVCQFDLLNGKAMSQMMRNKRYDFSNCQAIFVPHLQAVMGVHADLDKPRTIWFTPDLNNLQKLIDGSMPAGRVNRIEAIHPNGSTFFVRSFSDTFPGELIKVDLQEKKLESLLKKRPWIDEASMAATQPVSITTPEGETVYGYLTLPRDKKEKLPFLIYLIGGPGSRNYWGFDRSAQYYAAQGYGYLALNYRGCTGYGARYAGGHKQVMWAAQHIGDDAAIAARWAIDNGYADPGRIGIIGESFGGFGALSAAARHPDLFKAVSSFAGFFDINEMYNADKRDFPPWLEGFYKDLLADPVLARELSPITHAKEIRASVLLMHGDQDYRVERLQSVHMRDALKEAGKDVEMETLRWQGHEYGDEDQRYRYEKLQAEFLRKHLQQAPAQ